MKFILNDNNNEIINVAFVKKFYAFQDCGRHGHTKTFYVDAELIDNSITPYKEAGLFVTIATFDSGTAEENHNAAKAYLAELVDKLNGGSLQ